MINTYPNKVTMKELAKDTDIKVAIEQKQEEVLAELEELTTESVVTTLDQETLDKINKLLSDPEVIRRLVKIIEDTQEIGISIEGRAIVEDQQDIVDEAVQIAREEIIELISDQRTETPEEALDIFMEENKKNGYPPQTACIKAFESGIDVLMISEKRYADILKVLISQSENSPEFNDILNESVRRVIKFKEKLGLLEYVQVDEENSSGKSKIPSFILTAKKQEAVTK